MEKYDYMHPVFYYDYDKVIKFTMQRITTLVRVLFQKCNILTIKTSFKIVKHCWYLILNEMDARRKIAQ